jgi:hypothetical protein
MESTLMSAGLAGALGGPKNATTERALAQAPQFQTLMQQPQAAANTVPQAPDDRYVDTVPESVPSERPASLPNEVTELGKTMSEKLKMAMAGPDKLRQMPVADPYVAQMRAGLADVLQFQGSLMQFSLTMKSVELSTQGFQALYKMQG